jgi:hypothetical protein
MQESFCKVVGKVLKLWERFYCREKVGKVSKFQERLYNDNFKAGKGEERKGKGKLSVPTFSSPSQKENLLKTISIHTRWTFSIKLYTLLVSYTEYPRDKPFLLSMVSYLKG